MTNWKLKNLNILKLACFGYSDEVLGKKNTFGEDDFLDLVKNSVKKTCKSKLLRVGYAKNLNENYNKILNMINNYSEEDFDKDAEYLARELERLIGYNFKDRNIIFTRVESEDFCGLVILFLASKEDLIRDLKKDTLDVHKALTIKQTGSIDLALVFSTEYETGMFKYISKEAVETEHDPIIVEEFLDATTRDDSIKIANTLCRVVYSFADLYLEPENKIMVPKALDSMGSVVDIDHMVNHFISNENNEAKFREILDDRGIKDGSFIDEDIIKKKIKKTKIKLLKPEINSDKISITVPYDSLFDSGFKVTTKKDDKSNLKYVEISIKGFTDMNIE